MIDIPKEDLEFKENFAVELLCLDIIKNLREDLTKNPNLLKELKGEKENV